MPNVRAGKKLVLIADDDADDRMFLEQALRQAGYTDDIETVEDGEELIHYLLRTGPYSTSTAPRPSLLLLDLNMPRMNGFQALKEIKDHVELRRLPVVVLSTSTADEDVVRSYNLGVNSFVIKPFNFNRLVQIITALKTYWLETVRLPE